MADATVEAEPQVEAFLEVFGIAFGLSDVILLVVLGAGAFWYFVLKKDNSQNDAVANFQSYTIQSTPSTTRQSDNSFINKMKSSGRNIVVFYGSQTGTAEEFAGRLAKEAQRYGMKGMVADPEECSMEELTQLGDIENSLAIFCMATYGEGDPTDNAQEFYEWLQQGDCELSGLNYAVFALGNKTYEHYNAMGKYIDARLEELGGSRVFEMGMGDDDSNIEEDFITWKDRFWPMVCEKFGVEASGEDVSIRQYRLVSHDDTLAPEKVYTGEVARLHSYKTQRPPFDPKNPFMSQMTLQKDLHKGGDRSCLHVEMDITNSKMRYDAGDHIAVYPKNDSALVDKIGEILGVDLDSVFSLVNLDEDSSKKHPFPCPCSYRTALSYYVDITSNPRTHIFKELAEYTTDEKEKEMLKLIGANTPEGKEKYNKWVSVDNRNIVHILDDLKSCKPALDHLCELLPRIQCRYYSISSSPKVYPNSIHITAALVKYETPTGRINKGVATNYLQGIVPRPLVEGEEKSPVVPVFVRKSQFRLPTRPQTPIIMIGPGTGLAPFRGFIQERAYMKDEGKPVGESILFFGCRKKAEDFIYQEELDEYVNKGVLTMHVAYSRDQEKKVYVQHLLMDRAKEVWRLIGVENAHLYVCGDAKQMARDVHDVIEKIVRDEGGLAEAEASAYVKRMEAQKRYSADVWS
ncbi:NADPH--cytochrome P450 reductase [Orchesella cincta]|uniref:NADPH--cytochrome P450 reductase n=1 Tax=Orchesella cincta TaxID=48709 RepID=A0A1D2NBH9_ORCCI|nr:NADPH--cytochrome P450 reductase [Orchesella cincta]